MFALLCLSICVRAGKGGKVSASERQYQCPSAVVVSWASHHSYSHGDLADETSQEFL